MLSNDGREWLQKALDYRTAGVLPIKYSERSTVASLVRQGFLEERGGRWFITDAGKEAINAPTVNRRPVSAVRMAAQDEEAAVWAGWRRRE